MKLSVMFFGSYPTGGTDPSGADHAARYEDILAIARAADRLGFHAVWTPERHFQQVGQIFPSPPVLSAALAVATERIALRAGSAVLPLHHPLRVAEDWSVVDNLSHGRAGLSVATGWHSTDFVLAPGHYADRRERALRDIPLLRRLWAGEEAEFTDGTGRRVAVRPQPRPVQPALPLWMTSSGSPATWEAAGRLRTGVLAATVGQRREDLAERVHTYREAFAAAPTQTGESPAPTVTLMTHAYVGRDDAEVRSLVADPLKDYLTSYVRQTAANRGEDNGVAALTAQTVDRLAQFAFERYLAWGGLLGSPGTCHKLLADLSELGCDEVACFVDFGLDRDRIIDSLHRLADIGKDLA
ncbi:MupA/Atu3671 family FMN-dependent luciferase-like monooxygenase [Streptomyces olivochromogenes]|uniref:MupA/Atu3671 family FMN-dependent luciferase-like monooxygenase n=1 Tax=Streptomyces olivochromogenes TaxID=1963 RepID=UPI001F2C8844|nr:MupA/Atu3671 family FMN-dependent luciferase-like monooxygenase [Streptomyces olivochromogenes]MCF3135100.1 LLM class flavin-dependent oxidoreductase [Streptomyces olivochromogenes]